MFDYQGFDALLSMSSSVSRDLGIFLIDFLFSDLSDVDKFASVNFKMYGNLFP